MLKPGSIVVFPFPFSDKNKRKLRPALIINKIPDQHDLWLVCMISSNINKFNPKSEILMTIFDKDFSKSGLKIDSVIKVFRLAVIQQSSFKGYIGEIDRERLAVIKKKISSWLEE